VELADSYQRCALSDPWPVRAGGPGRSALRTSDAVAGHRAVLETVEATFSAAMRRLLACGVERLLGDDKPLRITVSAGVIERAPHEPLMSALERADRALYRAKEGGRNRVVAG
jgi:GGDEF domain-containing protein